MARRRLTCGEYLMLMGGLTVLSTSIWVPAFVGGSRLSKIEDKVKDVCGVVYAKTGSGLRIYNTQIKDDKLILFGEDINKLTREGLPTLTKLEFEISGELANRIDDKIYECERIFNADNIKSVYKQPGVAAAYGMGLDVSQKKLAVETLNLIEEAVKSPQSFECSEYGAEDAYIMRLAQESGQLNYSVSDGKLNIDTEAISATNHVLSIGETRYDEEMNETCFVITTWKNGDTNNPIRFNAYQVGIEGKVENPYERFLNGEVKSFRPARVDSVEIEDKLMTDVGYGEEFEFQL